MVSFSPTLSILGLERANLQPRVVRVNCSLVTDLNQVPKSLFIKKIRDVDGAPYSMLVYRLQVESNKSGLMKYSLEIEGKEYSAVDANY